MNTKNTKTKANKAITTLYAQTTAQASKTTAQASKTSKASAYQSPSMMIDNRQTIIDYYNNLLESERLQDGAQLVVNTALKTLRINGNETALSINQHSDIYQDLLQEATKALLECGMWYQNGSQIIFENETQKSAVYSSVSRYIYKHKTRIIKTLYIYNHNNINSKGETMDDTESMEIIRYTDAVRAYMASMKSIETRQAIEELRHILTDAQNKILNLLIDGYNQKSIAIIMNTSGQNIEQHIKRIRCKMASII